MKNNKKKFFLIHVFDKMYYFTQNHIVIHNFISCTYKIKTFLHLHFL